MTDKTNLPKPPGILRGIRSVLIWLIIIGLALFVAQYLSTGRTPTFPIDYSQFLNELKKNNVSSVNFKGKNIEGEFISPTNLLQEGHTIQVKRFKLRLPFDNPALVDSLAARGVAVKAEEESIWWQGLLINMLPWVLIIFLWLFLIRQMQGGQKGVFSFSKSRARKITPDKTSVTFDNVAGADEAKAELQEIIDFLRDPKKYTRIGARIPKGVLLLGPPGTGKTLLARAVAGEAKVPFFSMSGSDFVELFVGIGAARVRDLFNEAKHNAPCIIFIDEIDAVGRQRGTGLGGGHDEREQTLNQLLVEMDGFDTNEGIIVMAATNRPDILDPALLRPGRFDRRIVIDMPDAKGREGILRVHTKNLPLDDDVDLKRIAQTTPGLSGADLESIVNEAALFAAKRGKKRISQEDFESARDKVIMGVERRSLVITPEEKRITAYHEAGHALVGKLLPGSDPIHRVSIIPRGLSLGLTSFLPEKDRRIYSKSYLMGKLVHLMGGRASEELVFNEQTTGAASDLEQASELARNMVISWGMSEKIGPVHLAERQGAIFLGRDLIRNRAESEKMAEMIDDEVKRLVNEAMEKAKQLLSDNLDKLHLVANKLLEKETLTGEEIDDLLRGGSSAQTTENLGNPQYHA
jgi:cell division protease FtsH